MLFCKRHHCTLKPRQQVGTFAFTHISHITLSPDLKIFSSKYALLSILLSSTKRISHLFWHLGNCGWPWKHFSEELLEEEARLWRIEEWLRGEGWSQHIMTSLSRSLVVRRSPPSTPCDFKYLCHFSLIRMTFSSFSIQLPNLSFILNSTYHSLWTSGFVRAPSGAPTALRLPSSQHQPLCGFIVGIPVRCFSHHTWGKHSHHHLGLKIGLTRIWQVSNILNLSRVKYRVRLEL